MKKKVMLVSSSGGHWVQLNRLRPAFWDCDLTFMTTDPKYESDVGCDRFAIVPDASRWNKFRVLLLALSTLRYLIIYRPDIVVSTGAAPGVFAVIFGKMIGAKAIWVDSLANVDEVSLSGRLVGRFADLWLTQWPHLASRKGPHYAGSVL